VSVLTELAKFPREFQRLEFDGLTLDGSALSEAGVLFDTSRYFRTAEVIDFESVQVSGISQADLRLFVRVVLRRCRFLVSVSFVGWPTFSLQPTCFFAGNCLRELHLYRQDFSQPCDVFVLPPSVHLLDFSGSTFTAKSLGRLFTVLAKARRSLVLILADLAIQEWDLVFGSFWKWVSIFFLRELDWSGNPLLATYFVVTAQLEFLSLDRIFTPRSLSAMLTLFNEIPPGNSGGFRSAAVGSVTFRAALAPF
jgi:hypothetical protein